MSKGRYALFACSLEQAEEKNVPDFPFLLPLRYTFSVVDLAESNSQLVAGSWLRGKQRMCLESAAFFVLPSLMR